MILIEEMFVRRAGDVGVLGPQDVMIQSKLSPKKPNALTISAEVEVSDETAERTSKRRSKWLSVFVCCFPRKSSPETGNDTLKCEPEKKSKKPGLFRRLFGKRSSNRRGESGKAGRRTFMGKLLKGSRMDKVPSIEEIASRIEEKYERELKHYNSV